MQVNLSGNSIRETSGWNKESVFVYGTLKRGFNNHRYLKDAYFLGEAKTSKSYAMYSSGIPYVIRDQKISVIHGEVYEIDCTTLKNLDALEGHPNWYKREQVAVCLHEQNGHKTKVIAWLYFYPVPVGSVIQDGRYR